MSLNLTTIKHHIIGNGWERQRSSAELRSFVDGLHSRVADIELEVSL